MQEMAFQRLYTFFRSISEMSKWFSDISKLYSDFPSEFQTFSNEIQKFTCEFQIFPNEIKIVLIVNRAPHRGHQCLNMFVITLTPKKAYNCLSFSTVLPNVEPCGDILEQNESSVKTANASPSSRTSQSGWAAAGICPMINWWIHGTNHVLVL